jgi:hypothetical protein
MRTKQNSTTYTGELNRYLCGLSEDADWVSAACSVERCSLCGSAADLLSDSNSIMNAISRNAVPNLPLNRVSSEYINSAHGIDFGFDCEGIHPCASTASGRH